MTPSVPNLNDAGGGVHDVDELPISVAACGRLTQDRSRRWPA
jgi:hypothetical protein